jgi:hypothetical protein
MNGKEILWALKNAGLVPITNVFRVLDRNGSRRDCCLTYHPSDVFEMSGKTVYPEHRGRGVVVVDNETHQAATAMNVFTAFNILAGKICAVCGQEGYDGLCLKCRLTATNLP